MDAEKIQHERADGHERRDAVLVDGVAIDKAESSTAAGVALAVTHLNRTMGAAPGRSSMTSLSTFLNWPASPLPS
jgi:hypothetical protein